MLIDYRVALQFSGASGPNADVYRNGVLVAPPTNNGVYTESQRTRGTYRYRVGNSGTTHCSDEVTLAF